MRRWTAPLLVLLGLLSGARWAGAQTVQLPPPAASSLDRLAQAPALAPPPPTWDAYGSQAAQVFPSPAAPPPSTWAPSAIGGQPGYPGYSPAAPSLVSPQGIAPASYPAQGATFQQTYQQTMHVYQGARGSWAYLLGDGEGTRVGVNELDTTATFALPVFHNSPASGTAPRRPTACSPTCRRTPTTCSSTRHGIRSSRPSSAPNWASALASTPTGTCWSGRAGASWAARSGRSN